jgi:CheY-like chemotaxis protein
MMLEQVILNLTLNARDAMPDGGRIHLSTSIVNVETPNTSRYPEARPGTFVRLQVNDTGTGIPSDILPRIFEPFFTTKEKGQGSGLGLATVFGIVKQHLGWIEVDTELNRGTTFSILLPLSKAEPPSTFAPDTGAIDHHGSETVLLVEDEASLREALRNMLEWYGYQVLDAATSAQALRLWKSHRERIQLLLADIVLPDGFSGTELAAQLLTDKPGLRIIYSTGYTDTVGKEVPKGPGIRFLPKPYLPQTLAQTVRECLDEAAGPAR